MFEGYSDNPSSKDCAHMRRSGGTIGVTVCFISSMKLQAKKEEFLSNKHNKQRFIAVLSQRLEEGCEIHQARRAGQKGNRCWNIPAMRSLLGSVVTNNIMFLHAIHGCHTTSGVYGLGKKL